MRPKLLRTGFINISDIINKYSLLRQYCRTSLHHLPQGEFITNSTAGVNSVSDICWVLCMVTEITRSCKMLKLPRTKNS